MKITCPRCNKNSDVEPSKASRIIRIKRCDYCVSLDDSDLVKSEPKTTSDDFSVDSLVKTIGGNGIKISEKMKMGSMLVRLFDDEQLRIIRNMLMSKDKNSLKHYLKTLKIDNSEGMVDKIWEYWYG